MVGWNAIGTLMQALFAVTCGDAYHMEVLSSVQSQTENTFNCLSNKVWCELRARFLYSFSSIPLPLEIPRQKDENKFYKFHTPITSPESPDSVMLFDFIRRNIR